jgi:hypothetical protein
MHPLYLMLVRTHLKGISTTSLRPMRTNLMNATFTELLNIELEF